MSDQYPAPPPSGPAGLPPQGAPLDTSAWHLQWWFIIVCFFVFWPAGMVLLWVSPVPKKNAKIAVTAVMVLVPLIAGCGIVAALSAFRVGTDAIIEQSTTEPAIEQPFEEVTIGELPEPGPAPEVLFDPSTAMRVAEERSPEEHVRMHMQKLVDGDYATAYALLPADKQASYGDRQVFAAQVGGYGIQSFTIDNAVQTDTTAEVTTTMVTSNGDFQYVWTFVKDGDTWFVKSRTIGGMTE